MAGLPGKSDINTYGGAKQNYLLGVVDPTTDQDAAEHNQLIVDVAGMTRTAIRAWALVNAQPGPTIVSHDAVWGNGGGVTPTVTRTSAGIYVVTWPTTVTDELGNTQTVTHSVPGSSIVGVGWNCHSVARTAANVVTAHLFDPTTATYADLPASAQLLVYLL